MKKTAYTDASFDERTKKAGWGVVLVKGVKKTFIHGDIPALNNNYAELWAIYMAGILLGGSGEVYTDSQTAISYIKKQIRDKPRTQEQYINHKHNEFLAYKIRKLNITVYKTKAHTKNNTKEGIFNNIADLCAKLGRSSR